MDSVNNSGQNVASHVYPESEHGVSGGAIDFAISSIRQTASGEGPVVGPQGGEGGNVMEALEPILSFLIGMLADEGTSAEDKGKILDLLKDLKTMVDESGDQEMQNSFNNTLQNGYNELLNDPNVAPGDLMNLAELIDGTSTEDLQQRAQNEKNNAANNSNNNANNNANNNDNAVV